jgi:hypothetical protein
MALRSMSESNYLIGISLLILRVKKAASTFVDAALL